MDELHQEDQDLNKSDQKNQELDEWDPDLYESEDLDQEDSDQGDLDQEDLELEDQKPDGLEEPRRKEKASRRKRKRRQGGKIWLALIGVCVCVMVFSLYQLASIYLEYKAGTDEYDELQQFVLAELPEPGEREETPVPGEEAPEESVGEEDEGQEEDSLQRVAFAELKEINSNIIGWIQIPGTKISYPVMQGSDDAYYLNHTFRDKVNSAGSIFMETLNAADFTDYHTIIYGHNMKNGSMFGGLSAYQSPTYLVSHPCIYIDVEGGLLQYEIFSCYETTADSDSYTIGFAPDEVYAEYLDLIKGRSLYDTGVSVSIEDQVLTLSTCTRSGKENRFVVHAKRI